MASGSWSVHSASLARPVDWQARGTFRS